MGRVGGGDPRMSDMTLFEQGWHGLCLGILQCTSEAQSVDITVKPLLANPKAKMRVAHRCSESQAALFDET